MRIELKCDCGNVHKLESLEMHYPADVKSDERRKERALIARAGYKQKLRVHCNCGQRIELLFRNKDGRR